MISKFDGNWKKNNHIYKLAIIIPFLVLSILGGSACQSNQDTHIYPESTANIEPGLTIDPDEIITQDTSQVDQQGTNDPVEEPAAVEQPDLEPADPEVIRSKWETSPHADTFILDEGGNNNSCARCHSPVVWLPSMDDMPESCFACKFEVSEPPPLIPEEDWVTIDCKICHEVDKKGNVSPEFSWLEIAQIDEYAEVGSPTELCQKCHIEIDIPGHLISQVDGVHAGYECTDCHDAHDTTASCTAGGCHDDVLSPSNSLPGHDANHEQVSCVACHDAGQMLIDLNDDLWGMDNSHI